MKILQAKRVVNNYLDILLDDGRTASIEEDHPKIQEWIAQGNSIEEPTTAHRIGVAKAEKRREVKQYAQSLVDELESDIEVELRRARMDYYLVQTINGDTIPGQQFQNDANIVNQIVGIYQAAKQGIQDINALTTVTEVQAFNVSTDIVWP